MTVDLTDILVCPRCGPPFGLILLADEVRDRHVAQGSLGCANCYARFPVADGVADLRIATGPARSGGAPPAEPPPASQGAETPAAGSSHLEPPAAAMPSALRLAALMGLAGSDPFRSYALLAGPAAALAGDVAGALEGVEVIAASPPGPTRGAGGHPRVSRLELDQALPFYDRAIRGVALTGEAADALLEEGVRVLNPMGRLVLAPAPADAVRRLEAVGARAVARDGSTLVAVATAVIAG